jgi:hypothetical protein
MFYLKGHHQAAIYVTGLLLNNSLFEDKTLCCSLKITSVSEEHIAPIFRVEK